MSHVLPQCAPWFPTKDPNTGLNLTLVDSEIAKPTIEVKKRKSLLLFLILMSCQLLRNQPFQLERKEDLSFIFVTVCKSLIITKGQCSSDVIKKY
ncbi:hypothetical protein HanRHA438_Chr15g0696001 [Helianthus annuus]|uniref:Uncharacterized protein n=1 Tax=Helianthus annuus TaxID=4232 RepID=A0A251S6K3_HELAN|nr:hypothetical protein HanXRQr2_Chr15g0684001 [Helianthus annuus]KAJ0454682.1 hypothetical protein HanIR_Chr15g0742871 [Helianthus annuus]KAJ0830470.1 hypothetical protein HanPSC8_Chr15g0655811 [Helianthus annuus]KAJ0843856.1 hypothetical protein HanRHA438_Chr15g0696001 [Helianthus annuus]